MIFQWARAKPHHPAIIQPDTIITYRGLADAIVSISQRLATLNLDPQKPVGVSIEHPAKQLAVCFALQRMGIVVAPVYRGLLPYLRTIGIEDLIYESEGNVLSGGRNIRFDASWLPAGNLPLPVVDRSRPPAPAPNMIFFTSGSTGAPKKIIQTEAAQLERLNLSPLCGLPSYARSLILPGLATTYGFNNACSVLREGKTACFSLPDEGRLVLMSTYNIEHLVASPQQALALVDRIEANPGYRLESLHSIWISGAMISPDAIRRIQSILCRNVVIAYGSTEGSLVAIAQYDMMSDIPDAVGFLFPSVEMEIVDEADRVLPAGSEGFLRYRTPFFTKNFAVNNPGGQQDGSKAWFHSGDLGTVTEHGVLCIRGRGDDIINCGGFKISAVSIEEAALACTGVKDAGVCSIRGDAGADQVWIGLVTAPGFQLSKFQQSLQQHPRINELLLGAGAEVVAVDVIPRNQLGKIERQQLREKLRHAKAKA
jgi:acyl-coenzyme A synthetase/AMP-(fatty) acid ligase